MTISKNSILARFVDLVDGQYIRPIKPFNPDPMPTPIAPVMPLNPVKPFPIHLDPPKMPVDSIKQGIHDNMPTPIAPVDTHTPPADTVKLYGFHDNMPTPIDPLPSVPVSPASGADKPTATAASIRDGGFTLSIDDEGNIICADVPLYGGIETLTPAPVGIKLNDGGFVLTMGPDGTIVCGGDVPQFEEPSFEELAARPIANPQPGHPLICLPFEGAFAPLSEHDPVQSAIDKFIFNTTKEATALNTVVDAPADTHAVSLADVSEWMPVQQADAV